MRRFILLCQAHVFLNINCPILTNIPVQISSTNGAWVALYCGGGASWRLPQGKLNCTDPLRTDCTDCTLAVPDEDPLESVCPVAVESLLLF